MAGSPVKQERKEHWLALKANPIFAQDCIARIASGDSIRALAAEHDIPVNTFWRWITQEHSEDVAAARKTVAAVMADQMRDAAERVEAGELNPKAAQTAASIRQWLATRYDRATFGDKSQVDMHFSGVVDMNLAAVRELARESLEGEYTTLDESEDEHPLL